MPRWLKQLCEHYSQEKFGYEVNLNKSGGIEEELIRVIYIHENNAAENKPSANPDKDDKIQLVIREMDNYFIGVVYFRPLDEFKDLANCIAKFFLGLNSNDRDPVTAWGHEQEILRCRYSKEISTDFGENVARCATIWAHLRTIASQFSVLLEKAKEDCVQ
ncbi:MAG: hypothetical protein SFZ02_17455 [bacterium]|nr:hypothetical protein [bacterium]